MVIFSAKCKHFERRSINILKKWKATWQGEFLLVQQVFIYTVWGWTPAALTEGRTLREPTEYLTWAKTARANHCCIDACYLRYYTSMLKLFEEAENTRAKMQSHERALPIGARPAFSPQALQTPQICKGEIWERKVKDSTKKRIKGYKRFCYRTATLHQKINTTGFGYGRSQHRRKFHVQMPKKR